DVDGRLWPPFALRYRRAPSILSLSKDLRYRRACAHRIQSTGQGIDFGSVIGSASPGPASRWRASTPRHHGVTLSTFAGSTASPRRGITSCTPFAEPSDNKVSAGSSHACSARLKVPQCTGRNAPPPSSDQASSALAGPRWMSPHDG